MPDQPATGTSSSSGSTTGLRCGRIVGAASASWIRSASPAATNAITAAVANPQWNAARLAAGSDGKQPEPPYVVGDDEPDARHR